MMVAGTGVKIDISAEDRASAVFARLNQNVSSHMEEIARSGDGLSTSLGHASEILGHLGTHEPGIKALSSSMKELAEGAESVTKNATSALEVFKTLSKMGGSLGAVAGVVAGIVAAMKYGANVDARRAAVDTQELERKGTPWQQQQALDDFYRTALHDAAYERGERTQAEQAAEAAAAAAAQQAKVSAHDKAASDAVDPIFNSLASARLSPEERAARDVRMRMQSGLDAGTFSRGEVSQNVDLARRSAQENADLEKKADLQKLLVSLRKDERDAGLSEFEARRNSLRDAKLGTDELRSALTLVDSMEQKTKNAQKVKDAQSLLQTLRGDRDKVGKTDLQIQLDKIRSSGLQGPELEEAEAAARRVDRGKRQADGTGRPGDSLIESRSLTRGEGQLSAYEMRAIQLQERMASALEKVVSGVDGSSKELAGSRRELAQLARNGVVMVPVG